MWLFHLLIGLATLVIFLVTGKYMRADFPDKDAIPQDLRLLMRSRHIYILFSSLLHLIASAYVQFRPQIWRRSAQLTGTFFLTLGSILLIWAFIWETYYATRFSDLSLSGIFASAAGVLLHLIGGTTGQKHER